MIKSFKTRILVWTLSISAVVLLLFGVAIDRSYYRLQLANVDGVLNMIAAPRFHPPEEVRFWERFHELAAEGGRRLLKSDIALMVYTGMGEGESLMMGEGWDREILSSLPSPTGELTPRDEVERSEMRKRIQEMERRFSNDIDDPRRSRNWRLRLAQPAKMEDAEFLFVESGGERWRVAVYKMAGFNVGLGVRMSDAMDSQIQLRRAYLFALPLALLVLGLASWLFARKAIEPIVKLSRVAESLTASNLGVRIESSAEDREFADLISVFNGMLNRLERSFEQARRFSADAAHELKTPLAILQGHLEQAIQTVPDGSDAQREMGFLIEEVHRLKIISRKLLILAQADTGTLPLNIETVSINSLLAETLEDLKEHWGAVRIEWSRNDAMELGCDPSLMGQVFRNLCSNAFKYRASGEDEIRVELRREGDACVFEISNACQPLPMSERERLFDRFVRGDTARSRKVEGTGLGLSLSREFVNAHGGRLSIVDSDSETRITFRMVLPSSPVPPQAESN